MVEPTKDLLAGLLVMVQTVMDLTDNLNKGEITEVLGQIVPTLEYVVLLKKFSDTLLELIEALKESLDQVKKTLEDANPLKGAGAAAGALKGVMGGGRWEDLPQN